LLRCSVPLRRYIETVGEMSRFVRVALALVVAVVTGGVTCVDATCDGTLTFTVLGQPNIGVGFLDTNASFSDSLLLGETTLKSDGSTADVNVICSAGGELKVVFGATGAVQTLTSDSDGWTFDARNSTDALFTWRTKVCAAPPFQCALLL
jgi:hypothetical protein